MHANRLAEEQFGARRRGGHLAVDEPGAGTTGSGRGSADTRQARAVELQARVPVERRLLATVVPLEHAGTMPGAPALHDLIP